MVAVTPDQNQAFLREVDEELRRDQVEGMFRRYGTLLVLVVGVALIAFAAFLWWQHAQAVNAGRDGEALSQALGDLDSGKSAAAKVTLDRLARSGRPAYAASARLMKAGIALEKGDTAGAAAAYHSVSADGGLPAPFRDLALVRETATQYDTLPPAQVVARLKPLAVSGGPWFGSAGEMVAIAYLKMGKPDLAGPLFAAIARDKQAPASIRSRAVQMAGVLGIDAIPGQPSGAPAAAGGN